MHSIEDKPAIEYIAGTPFPKMSPKLWHGLTQAAACAIVHRCAERRGATSTETRFRLTADTTLVPDVSFVAYDRLRGLSADEKEEPPFAPDIAIEIRSKSDRASLIARKNALYLSHGALLVLNIDPYSRTMTAHSHDGESTWSASDTFESAAIAWLRFNVIDLFADLDAIP